MASEKKKNFFAKLGEKKTGGIIFLIVCILVCIPLSMLKTVAKLEKEAKAAYTENTSRYGDAEEDVGKLAGYASNLLSVCKASGVDCSELENLVNILKERKKSPIGLDDCYHELKTASSFAYENAILSKALTDDQKQSAILYQQEIESVCKKLANNKGYADAADAYNNAIESFPASLLFGRWEKAVKFN